MLCAASPHHPPFHLRVAGARAAAARAHRALYLFHPVQPFLAVALQDADTGIADSLAVFTRL